MPRGDSTKRARFDAGLASGLEPLEAAKRAGYAQPRKFLEAQAQRAQERGLEDALPDHELARRTLRSVAQYCEGSAQVQAAKALLDNALPTTPHSSGSSGPVVIFHGREGSGMLAGADPREVERAIALIRAANGGAIERFAAEHRISADEIRTALAAYRQPCARCTECALEAGPQAQPERVHVEPEARALAEPAPRPRELPRAVPEVRPIGRFRIPADLL